MPRKTKEQKELEEKKEVKKKVTSEKPKKSVAKKASTATKKTTAKKSTAKKSTAKKTTTTKKSATKKTTTTTKKVASKSTTKKVATKKPTTTKKKTATSKKSSTKSKKETLIDKSLEVTEYYDLPYKYNQTVVKILAQTPNTLFVYWEISDEDIENYKKQYGDNFFEITRPVLIVHNVTLDYYFEIEINDFANSWYLKVNNTKCEYKIELGRRPINNDFNEKFENNYIYVASSNKIESPNDHILINDLPNIIKFRNVKTNQEYFRKISELAISKNINKMYDLYKLIYQDENIDDLTNPSSGGNPSSGTFSSTFK